MEAVVYLIPSLLGENDYRRSLPEKNLEIIQNIKIFVVENEKSARRFIKSVLPNKPQGELEIHILDKKTTDEEAEALAQLFERGEPIGVISEAGLPGVADPGNKLVKLAHRRGVKVVPLVGPSSIFLALMASGLNGQQFEFHGYLPIDRQERKNAIKKLEEISRRNGSSQIFMETPYRNNALMEDLLKYLSPNTQLCVAADITNDSEFILTLTVSNWAKRKADLHKRPAIFILQS